VDAFIREYPYLDGELALLKGMVLPADEIVLDKQHLYRSDDTEQHLQEAMLLHLDNELEGTAKDQLLLQMQSDKKLQANWALLNKTKLNSAERISFPDKSILYRKEGSGRLITGRFVRLAVAAALIGAGFFVGISILKSRDNTRVEVSKNDPVEIKGLDTAFGTNTNKELAKDKDEEEPGLKSPVQVQKLTGIDNKRDSYATVIKEKNSKVKQKDAFKEKTAIAKMPSEIKPKKQSPVLNRTIEPENILASNNDKVNLKRTEANDVKTITASLSNKKAPINIKDPVEDINIMPVQNSFAKTAVMDEEETNNNHILFMNEENVTRSKTGAFFKKLKRTVARSTNIKIGNSFKFAGFEFAVK
ncbi:MAG TPA: hypothetical protein VLR49_09625, partial [Ferruginibacter sp.]|nr:hypothetical protein [Ferruginibacter sp.]